MDNKYHNGKIYAVRNIMDDDVYIGSTCSSLSQRMVKHRSASAKCVKMQLYDKMQELGADKFYIELVEDCNCDSIEQLRRREGELIRQMGTLNKRIDGRTKSEYSEDNREKKLQYMADNVSTFYRSTANTMNCTGKRCGLKAELDTSQQTSKRSTRRPRSGRQRK